MMTHTNRATPVSEMPLRDLVSNYLALKRQARNGDSAAGQDAALFRQEIKRREIDHCSPPVETDKRAAA
jgi:hypothetical protein